MKKQIERKPATIQNLVLTAMEIVKDPMALRILTEMLAYLPSNLRSSWVYGIDTKNMQYPANPDKRRRLLEMANCPARYNYRVDYGYSLCFNVYIESTINNLHPLTTRYESTKEYWWGQIVKPRMSIYYNIGGFTKQTAISFPEFRKKGIVPLRTENYKIPLIDNELDPVLADQIGKDVFGPDFNWNSPVAQRRRRISYRFGHDTRSNYTIAGFVDSPERFTRVLNRHDHIISSVDMDKEDGGIL